MSEVVEDILTHYGVKGMKWGVRRSSKSSSTPKPRHADAVRANASYQKAKTKGSAALSNKELKDLNERIRLEQQFRQLDPQTTNAGKKFVAQQMKNIAGMVVTAAATKHIVKRIV